MKERFENYLTSSKRSNAETETSVALIEKVVDEETRALIQELQAKKFDFVDGLRAWRKKFWEDSPEETDLAELQKEAEQFELQKNSRPLEYREGGTFATRYKGGEEVTLDKGEVMSAAEWGFWWRFDNSVPEAVQKEIMSHQVRTVIAEQYDRQLVQLGKANTLNDDRKRDTYERIERSNFDMKTMPNGILAEKMILSFLTKQMHQEGADFIITNVDVYEDVEHKIDFVIEVADRRRGVKVNEPEHRSRIGIQFTMDEDKKELKEKQMKSARRQAMEASHLDETVLITLPINDIRPLFDAWRYTDEGIQRNYNRLDPRGPDHLWSEDIKQQIMDGLVRGIKAAEAAAT